MAKGKRAAALFEVIQAAKEREQLRAKGGGFLTPSWWFKGKAANGAPAPAPTPPPAPAKKETRSRNVLPSSPAPIFDEPVESQADPSPFGEPQPYTESVEATSEPDAHDNAAVTEDTPSGTFTPEPPAPPVHHDFVDNEEPALEDPKEDPKPGPLSRDNPAPISSSRKWTSNPRKPVDVGVDHGRQQIILRLSFTSAAISSFALIVIVALAVLIGKNFGKGPALAGAASIEDVKKTKPNSSVLNVFQGKSGNDDAPIAVAPAPKPPVTPAKDQKPATPAKQNETAKQSTPTVAPPAKQTPGLNAAGKRIVGNQYVLIQSYPDPEDANEAAAALKSAGIDATVERLTHYTRWPCVVGARGFDHTKNNPEFEAYMKSIRDVSAAFAGHSNFRKFDPQVIGWKE